MAGQSLAYSKPPSFTPPGTFDQPGRYLVIRTTFVHFVFANMYGWVIVR